MPSNKCPGQDKRSWKPGDIHEAACLFCDAPVEFWKDDVRQTCVHCGAPMRNPRFDMGCAEWCSFAMDCIGARSMDVKASSLCATLIRGMEALFDGEARRIRHTLRVLSLAEQILEMEDGEADPLVVMAAAVLHDTGNPAARDESSSHHETELNLEGPSIARRILGEAGVDAARQEHICQIIADHRNALRMDSTESRILWDAEHLVNHFVEGEQARTGVLNEASDRTFKTTTGRQLADRLNHARK